MKANGAPEKIYIHVRANKELGTTWHGKKITNSDIEYVRKDAFIEKACELLARMVWDVTYEDLEGNSVQHYDKMEFVEDFKNYMKGE